MQLRCGEIFNIHSTATCSQCATKNFWKSVNIWQRCGQSQSGTFFRDTVYYFIAVVLQNL